MRKLVLVAAMLMASASAHAGNSFSFNIEGHKVRVDVPRNCAAISCLSISAPSLIDKFKSKDEDDEPVANNRAPTPAPAVAAPAAASAQPSQAAQPAQTAQPPVEAPAPVASPKVTVMPPPATEIYSTSNTATTAALAPAQAQAAAPVPVATPAAEARPAAVVASAPVPAASPATAPVATSPIGLWMSEKKEGKIRVEDCNGNLCGYAVDAKTGANGAKILINMKPSSGKWAGRIHDTRSGGTYDSTVALRGADKLRVQGCAFGGMFCGGETWTRIE